MESIKHIFQETKFNEDFGTHNTILDKTPYKPKVMILGTFNPALDSNPADFFYGRNYFWTAFKNIFIHNQIRLHCERLENCPYNPSIDEIFELCKKTELTFSDLISEISDEKNNLMIKNLRGKDFIQNADTIFNPIKDNDLENLDRIGNIKWNTQHIINYLMQNTQIHTIYFTRGRNGKWGKEIAEIQLKFPNIEIISLYTPSAQGGALHKQTEIYGKGKMIPLLKHWIHNDGVNNGRLDRTWIISKGVNSENF